MKYTTEVRIELPRRKVVELFANADNLYKWQEGLKSFTHLEGEPGQEGSRSRLVYEGRRGTLTLTETIVKRSYPDEFHTRYESKGVYNKMVSYFDENGENQTRWRTVNIFKFRGLMAVMAPFMKPAFTRNTLLNMERFKYFAENKGN